MVKMGANVKYLTARDSDTKKEHVPYHSRENSPVSFLYDLDYCKQVGGEKGSRDCFVCGLEGVSIYIKGCGRSQAETDPV